MSWTHGAPGPVLVSSGGWHAPGHRPRASAEPRRPHRAPRARLGLAFLPFKKISDFNKLGLSHFLFLASMG